MAKVFHFASGSVSSSQMTPDFLFNNNSLFNPICPNLGGCDIYQVLVPFHRNLTLKSGTYYLNLGSAVTARSGPAFWDMNYGKNCSSPAVHRQHLIIMIFLRSHL